MTKPSIRFDKLDLIEDAINPRFKEVAESIDLGYRYIDPTEVPDVVDPTVYSPRSYYRGLKTIKRPGVQVQWTDEMKKTLWLCKNDILFFAEKFFTIRTLDHGKIKIPLRDYQKFWLRVSENPEIRNRVWLACRQSAKSTTLTIEILHRIIFNDDYQYVILANKGGTAREIFSRVRLAYEGLPLWMQVGVKEWNKGSVELENDSKVFAASTSSDSIRGFSPNEVLLDETAFIKNDEEFMNSTYPVISSGTKSRMTMISTPNGPRGVFHNNYKKAIGGKNSYFSFKVPWHFVPDRDEEWKRTTIENTSLTQFRQEQDVEFVGASGCIVSAEVLERMGEDLAEPVKMNDYETWDDYTDVFEQPKEGNSYIATVDTAEGKEKDASTITVWDVTQRPFRQVLTYQNRSISPLLFPHKIKKICEEYNKALAVVENNNAGMIVAQHLYLDLEYENVYCSNMTNEMGIGIRTTHSLKALGVSLLTSYLEKRGIIVQSAKTHNEIANFVRKGAGWEGEGSSDDLVQNCWMFAWFTSQADFQENFKTGNLVQELYAEDIEDIYKMQISVDRGQQGNQSGIPSRGSKSDFW